MGSLLNVPGWTPLLLCTLPLLAFSAYWTAWIIYTTTFHPLRKIPGPFLASISRLWMIWRIYKGDMEHAQRSLHAKHGPLIRIAPDEIACADPAAIKDIYPTQSPLMKTDFYSAWESKEFSKYPDHFSVTDEELHTERRRIVNQVYTLSNVLQSEEYIDKCSLLFVDRLGEFADQSTVLNLGEWLQWYTFDVIGELFFGSMFGFMQNREDHGSYIAALDTLMPVMCIVAVAPTYVRALILMSSIVNPVVRKGLGAINHIIRAAKECVIQRVDRNKESGKTLPRRDMLQQLLDLIGKEKRSNVDFDIPEVQIEAYASLFAGSDTTAIALRAVFYYLLKDRSIYVQLQHEIDNATHTGILSSPPKYAESLQLPFLTACIKEALRMHPSVGLTMPRLVPPGGMTLCNTYIRAGYRVGINGAVVHYDKTVFGADAEYYRPQRWLDGESDVKRMEKSMLHFGAGKRTCLGKNISLTQIHKLVPLVLQKLELELEDPEREWTTDNKWFNKQTTGLEVFVRRRG